jgi:hypothetical protein
MVRTVELGLEELIENFAMSSCHRIDEGDVQRASEQGTSVVIANKNELLESSSIWLFFCGAGNGTRTRDIDLGKVALYQLSYSRRAGPA